MPAGYRWRIWIRREADRGWMKPVIAGSGANVGWDSKEDAEMGVESFPWPRVAWRGSLRAR
jgi:hypothetical protein